jgi:hypothetical protein
MEDHNDNPKRKIRFERVRIAHASSKLHLEQASCSFEPRVEASVSLNSDLFGFDSSKFDLMKVRVTVYSLSGILRSVPREKKKTKRPLLRRRKISKSSENELLVRQQNAPPVTAVVSCMRNVNGSSNSTETLIPSIPFESDLSGIGSTNRFVAVWPAANSSILLESESADQSTFDLIRVMKHEPYRRGTRANHVSYYIPETIDLKISVGYGKNLSYLGIASFVITGDEEGEVIINIPAKKGYVENNVNGRGNSSSCNKSKGSDKLASNCESISCFELDENATLKVGIQVLPQSQYYDSKRKTTEEKEGTDIEFEKLLTGILDGLPDDGDELLFHEGKDNVENIAIIQNVPHELLELKAAKAKAKAKAKFVVPVSNKNNNPALLDTPKVTTGLPRFFCDAMTGAIEVCSATSKTDIKQKDECIPRNINANRHHMLPLSLISSVSESLTTATDYRL